ncbi:electron transfer flavoprotein beta subunit [Paraburkholderia sp. BL18I3N2]|uniref:electron transfer flavoprotein subunit beta n=1 Tax=unclassified Paraburkholderia TaxID=2615204 RepID=UPI000D065410|nr:MULTISPECIES: electron transfer flavoprotein subunit beta [unclassified Paraburkholderia]PRX18848.1 electron transfer flavoprotein beta subunit [Paraburkholderia sp. BL18I3N2]PRX87893.1 electron transfer flavoprotein beta subunit [Paraburkholderia sp. BL25I1N1]
MQIDLMLLLSLGQHPLSLRSQMASVDARAVELALRLGDAVRVHAVYAGDPDEPALRDYLGLGLASLTVLRQPRGADVLPALCEYLLAKKPALTLAGMAAEVGEGSGMLPYLLAEALGATLLAGAASVALGDFQDADGQHIRAEQALARGQRRLLQAALPCVITVAAKAPVPRQSAYARARAGRVEIVEPEVLIRNSAELLHDTQILGREVPARKNPKRIPVSSGGSLADRLNALTATATGAGRLMVQPSPVDAALAILEYLKQEQVVMPPASVQSTDGAILFSS